MEWVQPVIQLVTAGGFGALVWYFVIYTIPKMSEAHRQEREKWIAYAEKRDTQLTEVTQLYYQAVEALRMEMRELNDRLK